MMKTLFTLIFFEAPQSVSSLRNAINGPHVFTCRESAVLKLFDYVLGRLSNGWLDGLEDWLERLEQYPIDEDEAEKIAFLRALSIEQKESLINQYFDLAGDELTHAGYSIEESPSLSLEEALSSCDAVECDDCFFRYFEFNELQTLEEDSDIAFDAKMVDEDFNERSFTFNYREVLDAVYCQESRAWRVNGAIVRPIFFCK